MIVKDYWTWFGYFSKEISSKGMPYNGWHYYMIPVKDWLRHPIKSRKLFIKQIPTVIFCKPDELETAKEIINSTNLINRKD